MKVPSFPLLTYILGADTICAQAILSRSKLPSSSITSSITPTSTVGQSTATPCAGNTPDDRSSWCQYGIDTDYELIVPETGVTREYWFDVDELTLAPDGFSRPVMAVNKTIPGPTIFADWGDWVVIHVTNHLDQVKNGSSIHWHGIRQNYTNQNDGVVSVTQCPIAPGSTMTYKWRAVQYGSSWYHSHIGLQAWEGVFGGIVINGPATANYDVDKGSLFLNDWTHATSDELYQKAETTGPFALDNGLINGTNVLGTGANEITGSRFTMKVDEDTSYRLRIVNGAIDTHWSFQIDNHTLTVIAMDFVPIEPFTTDVLSIGMGQRYDVIVSANQSSVADSFWIRAEPQSDCSSNLQASNIQGILYYQDTPTTPQTSPLVQLPDSNCLDMPSTSLVPYVPKDVSSPVWDESENVSLNFSTGLFRWELNTTSMRVSWEDPTLLQIYNDQTNFTGSSGVIELPYQDEWVYLMINTTVGVTHPIHLHGHDFYVLAQGSGLWNGSLTTSNPPRRDTAMLPKNGHLLIAFKTDNPGAWLMHCHIGWHIEEGFALQFIERYDEIQDLIDYDGLQDVCQPWNAYDQANNVIQTDSGV